MWKRTHCQAIFTLMATNYTLTYPGQAVTCKYCGETGHMQAECKKRKSDISALQKNSINRYYEHVANNLTKLNQIIQI